MFGKTFPLFKVFGIQVQADLSWLIIVVLVTWSLAAGVFPTQYKGVTDGRLLDDGRRRGNGVVRIDRPARVGTRRGRVTLSHPDEADHAVHLRRRRRDG